MACIPGTPNETGGTTADIPDTAGDRPEARTAPEVPGGGVGVSTEAGESDLARLDSGPSSSSAPLAVCKQKETKLTEIERGRE